ncbi:MAG: hypothetical protein GF390_00040 [Candidatus Pacebacteria bacterium]|nr:hypothetical protein [Candidatus Paceibacterota bacterium]
MSQINISEESVVLSQNNDRYQIKGELYIEADKKIFLLGLIKRKIEPEYCYSFKADQLYVFQTPIYVSEAKYIVIKPCKQGASNTCSLLFSVDSDFSEDSLQMVNRESGAPIFDKGIWLCNINYDPISGILSHHHRAGIENNYIDIYQGS